MRLDFKGMPLYEKLLCWVRLWLMDCNPFSMERYWCILEPSYYFWHTEEECEKEKVRRKGELLKIIEKG